MGPLGSSWGFLAFLGASCGLLKLSGASWSCLGASWGLLGPLGFLWGVLAPLWGFLGRIGLLGFLAPPFGASWGLLAFLRSWGLLGFVRASKHHLSVGWCARVDNSKTLVRRIYVSRVPERGLFFWSQIGEHEMGTHNGCPFRACIFATATSLGAIFTHLC